MHKSYINQIITYHIFKNDFFLYIYIYSLYFLQIFFSFLFFLEFSLPLENSFLSLCKRTEQSSAFVLASAFSVRPTISHCWTFLFLLPLFLHLLLSSAVLNFPSSLWYEQSRNGAVAVSAALLHSSFTGVAGIWPELYINS